MTTCDTPIRLALPKGRMQDGIADLLHDAGIDLRRGARQYRPAITLDGWEAKILKPQSVVEMLDRGVRDVGFAGADWIAEFDADVVELLDTRLDPVRLIAAAPEELLDSSGRLPDRPLVIASEYERITCRWAVEQGLDATFVHSRGATEVYPPEDADCIVDNTATGATLAANGLQIVDTIMTSSTRLYASRAAMSDARRAPIEQFVMLVRSVIDARTRVLVEVNVSADRLDAVVAALPCMREPTIAALRGDGGYAVRAAVPRSELACVVPNVKAAGGTDLLVFNVEQIVP